MWVLFSGAMARVGRYHRAAVVAGSRLTRCAVGGVPASAWILVGSLAMAQGKRGAPPEKPAEPSHALGYFLTLALIAIAVAVVGRPHRRAKDLNVEQH